MSWWQQTDKTASTAPTTSVLLRLRGLTARK